MKLHVINLKHRIDRLDRVTKECEKEGVEFMRIDAIKDSGKGGPGKSHCKAIEYAIENNMDEILVTEDDIIFNKNFKENFKKCYENLPQDWDIMLGGVSVSGNCEKVNKYLVKMGFFTGLHFIIYRKTSYEKVLDWKNKRKSSSGLRRLNRTKGEEYLHVDRYIGGLSSRGELNIYCARHFLVDTYNCFSDVRNKLTDDNTLFNRAKETVLKAT